MTSINGYQNYFHKKHSCTAKPFLSLRHTHTHTHTHKHTHRHTHTHIDTHTHTWYTPRPANTLTHFGHTPSRYTHLDQHFSVSLKSPPTPHAVHSSSLFIMIFLADSFVYNLLSASVVVVVCVVHCFGLVQEALPSQNSTPARPQNIYPSNCRGHNTLKQ